MTRSRSDTALVFPGQGSQRPGMGAAFHEAWPETRESLAALDDALPADLSLRELCFEADAATLRATDRTQPAVFATGLAAYRGLRERTGIESGFVAGHSLGHLTAMAASGMLDPVAGIRLVRDRGRIMAEVANEGPEGVMCAVLLADPDTVVDACAEREDVSVAAFNAPRETVISGTAAAVEAVRQDLDRATRARFRELDTDTAFHSPLMEPARDAFAAVLETADLSEGAIPVASDVSGTVYTEPSVARTELTAQVTAPIDWVGTIRTLRDRGVERYVELPPAGTLGRLIERIDPDATVVTLDEPGDAEALA